MTRRIKKMKWIIDNWSLLVVLACMVVLAIVYVKKFVNMPTNEQLAKVREWLLYAVIQAEKELGAKTGQIKLRYVYDMFLSKFPALVSVITFEMFSQLVDQALEQMKHLMETNNNARYYIQRKD